MLSLLQHRTVGFVTLRHCCLALVGVFAVAVGRIGGQQPPPPRAVEPSAAVLCQQVRAADKLEDEFLQDSRSAAQNELALNSAELWRVVTAPETPYRERLVAATRGNAIAPAQLPALWTAVAAFGHMPTGVYPSPCAFNNATSQPGRSPNDWFNRAKSAAGAKAWTAERREILDRSVDLPMTAIDYPLTMADRERAPWLWQMSHVLPILMKGVKVRYAAPSEYRALKDEAFKWKVRDWYEASVRNDALRSGPRNADWVAAIVGLALDNPSAPFSDVDRFALLDLYVCCEDTYRFEELVHVAQIVIMQETREPFVAASAAHQVTQMATSKFSFSTSLKPLRSATAILALSRWAVNRQIPASLRYLSFAGAIAQMVPDPPFVFNRALSNTRSDIVDQSPEVASALTAFEAWLEVRRLQLEQEAAAERRHWNNVAAEIGRTLKGS